MSISTNVRKFRETSNNEIDDSNNFDGIEMRRNLLKFNFSGTCFLISEARVSFTCLRKTLTKTPILHHFNLERHIQIETDVSDFPIREIFNQLT